MQELFIESEIRRRILEIYAKDEVTCIRCYEHIGKFVARLIDKYGRETCSRVRLYHVLIGSGLPKGTDLTQLRFDFDGEDSINAFVASLSEYF